MGQRDSFLDGFSLIPECDTGIIVGDTFSIDVLHGDFDGFPEVNGIGDMEAVGGG